MIRQEVPLRKIIQIADIFGELFSLCNDGTLWQYRSTDPLSWIRMPSIPQPCQEGKV